MNVQVVLDWSDYTELKRAIHVIEYSIKYIDTSYWVGEILGALDDIKKVLNENKE